MVSQLDLDQGGTNRQWIRKYLGPSVGWIYAPQDGVLPITATGTYTVVIGTTLVTVSVAGAVVINLPTATNPIVPAGALPGPFGNFPITIVDIGGNAATNPITINPAAGENVLGLSQITLSTPYGSYSLRPNSTLHGWTETSP